MQFQDLFSATTNHTLVEPWRTVNLTRTVQHVQGGEYYGGMLFLSTNEETERPVYIFDASTGQLVESFGTVAGGEGEGLGIVPPAAPSGGQWPGLIVGHTKHVLGVPVGADYMLYQRRAQ